MATDVQGIISAAQGKASELATSAGAAIDNAMRAFDYRSIPGGGMGKANFLPARVDI